MSRPVLIKLLLLAFTSIAISVIQAQNREPFSCFNAEEIHFPLSQNDFSKSEIFLKDRSFNAIYYLYQDKYSFWYKFIVHKDLTIQFSVSPSNIQDRYRAVAFKYGGADFCDKLVNENMEPFKLKRDPIFREDGEVLYRNTISAAAGDTFYISVLSLTPDDCGHFLYIQSENDELSIHAVHKPCYNFMFLDIPDFKVAEMNMDDVGLDMVFETAIQDTTPAPEPAPPKAFDALTTIEIQSREESLVSVGDKLILNEVYFYNNTYAFKPGAETELDQLVNFLESNPTVEIEIQGHTANDSEDIRPDPNFKNQGKEWNFKGSALELSSKRAQAVAAYLTAKGIDKKRLKSVGYGASQKRIPDAKTFEESEKNMRVEALITKE